MNARGRKSRIKLAFVRASVPNKFAVLTLEVRLQPQGQANGTSDDEDQERNGGPGVQTRTRKEFDSRLAHAMDIF